MSIKAKITLRKPRSRQVLADGALFVPTITNTGKKDANGQPDWNTAIWCGKVDVNFTLADARALHARLGDVLDQFDTDTLPRHQEREAAANR